MRRLRLFFEKQGFFVLLAVCILIIAASAAWAYWAKSAGEAESPANASTGHVQRLADVETVRLRKPVDGETLLGYEETAWLETLGCFGGHQAVDLAAEKGDGVVAPQEGTVVAAYRDRLWGGVVEIQHQDGVLTRTCGLAWPVTVNSGETVTAGQAIGAVGLVAMESADMPHVHLEVYSGGMAVNPARFIAE